MRCMRLRIQVRVMYGTYLVCIAVGTDKVRTLSNESLAGCTRLAAAV